MPRRLHSVLVRFGVAVASTLLAAGVRLALDPVLRGRATLVTFYLAVLVSGWLGGLGPALLALGLSTLAVTYFLIPPEGQLTVAGIDGWVVLGLFVFVGVSTALLSAALRAARLRAEAGARQAVDRQRELECEVVRRQEAEERAHELREWLQGLLTSIGDAVIATDTEGRVVFLNPVAEALTGWPGAEARGRPLAEVFRAVHEDGREPVEDLGARVLREGRVARLADHCLLVARDGREAPSDVGASPIRDGVGRLLGLVLVFRNVEERRRTERRRAARLAVTQVLAEAATIEEALPRILRVICEGLGWDVGELWLADPGAGVLRCRAIWHAPAVRVPEFEAASRALTLTPGVGLPGRVWSRRRPEWISDVTGDANCPRAALAGRGGLHGTFGCPVFLGSTVIGVLNFFSGDVREPDDDLLEMMATLGGQFGQFLDRKRSEEAVRDREQQLRLALEAGRMGTWDWDLQTGRLAWSENLEPMHGLVPGTFAGTFEAFRALVHPDDLPRLDAAIARALADRGGFEVEFRNPHPDGSVHWIVGKGQVFIDPDGQPARMVGVGLDITDRKRAEEQLREETRIAEALNCIGRTLAAELDPSRLVQILIDETTRLVDAQFGAFFDNTAADEGVVAFALSALSGAAPGGFAGLPMPCTSPLFGPILRGERVVRLGDVTADPQFRGLPEGHPPVRSFLAAPVISRSGPVLGGLVFGHERPGAFGDRDERLLAGITAQAAVALDNARLLRAAREAEQRFRQIAEHISDVLYMTDPLARRVFYISPAYETIWGRSCCSLDNTPRLFLEAIHPDDRPRIWAAMERQARGEATAETYRIVRPDGAIRWIWDRAFPIRDAAGAVARIAGIAEDITERHRAEQTARFLADASTSLAALVDDESTLQTVARLAVPFFADWCAVDLVEPGGALRRLAVAHINPEKVALGHELQRRYPPCPEVGQGVWDVVRTGRPVLVSEITEAMLEQRIRDPEHRRILRDLGLCSYLMVPLVARGTTLGVITFVAAESGRSFGPQDLAAAEDLANRATIAMENARLYRELREADRRKDEFLAMLAHELRNPLAPIANALTLLGMDESGASNTGWARELIERQVQHMVRLVDDLLDISRIMRGKIELRREPVELAAVVRHAVETARPVIEALKHELTVALPSEAIWLEADPVRLAQVLANLLNNAAKYTEQGGSIRLSAEREGDTAVLRVADNGIGIAPEMLPRIFELFKQASRAVDRSQGGLGIGLTVVRSLVEMHGGSVTARSEGPGTGSEFTVRLPIPVRPRCTEPAPGRTPARTDEPRRRVLIVDDNEDSARSLAAILRRRWGYDVQAVHDGPAALQAAADFHPEVILLDIGLPGLSGYEVARRLRERPDAAGILLVAMTGYGQEEDRRRSREAGFDQHLVKPVALDALDVLFAHPFHSPA